MGELLISLSKTQYSYFTKPDRFGDVYQFFKLPKQYNQMGIHGAHTTAYSNCSKTCTLSSLVKLGVKHILIDGLALSFGIAHTNNTGRSLKPALRSLPHLARDFNDFQRIVSAFESIPGIESVLIYWDDMSKQAHSTSAPNNAGAKDEEQERRRLDKNKALESFLGELDQANDKSSVNLPVALPLSFNLPYVCQAACRHPSSATGTTPRGTSPKGVFGAHLNAVWAHGEADPLMMERLLSLPPGSAAVLSNDSDFLFMPTEGDFHVINPDKININISGGTVQSVSFPAVHTAAFHSYLRRYADGQCAEGAVGCAIDRCELALLAGCDFSHPVHSLKLAGQDRTVYDLVHRKGAVKSFHAALDVLLKHGGLTGLVSLLDDQAHSATVLETAMQIVQRHFRFDRSVPITPSPFHPPPGILSRLLETQGAKRMSAEWVLDIQTKPFQEFYKLSAARLASIVGRPLPVWGDHGTAVREPLHPYGAGVDTQSKKKKKGSPLFTVQTDKLLVRKPGSGVNIDLWLLNLPKPALDLSPAVRPAAAAMLYLVPAVSFMEAVTAVAAADAASKLSPEALFNLCQALPRRLPRLPHRALAASAAVRRLEAVLAGKQWNTFAKRGKLPLWRPPAASEPRVVGAAIHAASKAKRLGKANGEAVVSALELMGLPTSRAMSVFKVVTKIHSLKPYAYARSAKQALTGGGRLEIAPSPTAPASVASTPVCPLYPSLPPLPADAVWKDIIDTVGTQQVTLIGGETGSGKSSRVPLILLAGWKKQREEMELNGTPEVVPFLPPPPPPPPQPEVYTSNRDKRRKKKHRKNKQKGHPTVPLSPSLTRNPAPFTPPSRPRLLVVEPRRLAAFGLCRRVRDEVQRSKLPIEVGFAMGGELEKRDSADLLFCTSGWLLQKLLHQPAFLGSFTALLLDEVHERHVDADILSALIRHMQLQWLQISGTRGRPFPRILLMSATLDLGVLSAYFSDQPMKPIHCGGKCFPVKRHFLEDLQDRRFPKLIQKSAGGAIEAFSRTARKGTLPRPQLSPPLLQLIAGMAVECIMTTPGSVLVFLPGLQTIEDLHERLETISFNRNINMELVILHSLIPFDEQQKALTPDGQRIYLSTNIAQTSLTLPDVTTVIDSCLQRHMCAHQLSTIWISKADCSQRAGRAGRVMPGSYYAMCSKNMHAAFMDHQLAEIHSSPLEDTLLRMLSVQKTATGMPMSALPLLFATPDPPQATKVKSGLARLCQLGAIVQPYVTGDKSSSMEDANSPLEVLELLDSMPMNEMDLYPQLHGLSLDLTTLGGLLAALPMDTSLAMQVALAAISETVPEAGPSQDHHAATDEARSPAPITPTLLVGLVAASLSLSPYRGRHPRACKPAEYLLDTGRGLDAQIDKDPVCSDVISDIQALNHFARLQQSGRKGIALWRECTERGLSRRQVRRLQLHAANAAGALLRWSESTGLTLIPAASQGLTDLVAMRPCSAITDQRDIVQGARALFLGRMVLALGSEIGIVPTKDSTKSRQKRKKKALGAHTAKLIDLPTGTTLSHVKMAAGPNTTVTMEEQKLYDDDDDDGAECTINAFIDAVPHEGPLPRPQPHNQAIWEALAPPRLPAHVARLRGLMFRNKMPMPYDVGASETKLMASGLAQPNGYILSRTLPCHACRSEQHPLISAAAVTSLERGGAVLRGVTMYPLQPLACTGILALCTAVLGAPCSLALHHGAVAGVRVQGRRDLVAYPLPPHGLSPKRLLERVNETRVVLRDLWHYPHAWQSVCSRLGDMYSDLVTDVYDLSPSGVLQGLPLLQEVPKWCPHGCKIQKLHWSAEGLLMMDEDTTVPVDSFGMEDDGGIYNATWDDWEDDPFN
eukprot:gnl/Dysnectes_brevis/3965_a5170_648.p1 GENE.gnl/Dysnectes_brevis/3965_a5170_648~~gnl/Dysnectes_brevis/3965_a5170_648.p1  ORF type:complete len:1845 (+),score=476.47 gnl/Dysnectes_brevis/3965_a5170_648:1-5535(+)